MAQVQGDWKDYSYRGIYYSFFRGMNNLNCYNGVYNRLYNTIDPTLTANLYQVLKEKHLYDLIDKIAQCGRYANATDNFCNTCSADLCKVNDYIEEAKHYIVPNSVQARREARREARRQKEKGIKRNM